MSRINILFVALLLSLAGCATPTPVSEVTPTAAATRTRAPSATPSPTQTVTRAPTFTRPPTDTPTARPTNTPLPPPTFTPATPLAEASHYQLAAWSAEGADMMIDHVRQYAVLKTTSPFGYPSGRLAQSVTIAQSEALMRFDNTSFDAKWRWNRAYYFALSNGAAGETYATLLAEGLNKGEASINTLSAWFKAHQEGWALDFTAIRVPAIYKTGHLVELVPELEELGGSCIILLQDQNGYRTAVAYSGYNYSNIENGLRLLLRCQAVDLTADSFDEVLAGAYFGGRLGFSPETVFSLATFSPTKLSFDPAGLDHVGGWLAAPFVTDENKETRFYLTRFHYPCDGEIDNQAELSWNGLWFEQHPYVYTVSDLSSAPYFDLCWDIIKSISSDVDPLSNINLMQAVLKTLPSLVSKDEARYRLGLSQALVGDPSASISTLTDLIAAPTVITSTWVAPAQEFLEAYKTPDDLYRACAQAPLCEPRFAIEQLTRTLPRDSFALALDGLRERGVPIAASGLFDFDGDGEAEHWFTIRHPGHTKTELWIVARTPEGMKALRVSEISSTPSFARLITGDETRATIQLTAGGAESFFVFVRAPNTREPFVAVIETTSTPPETAATLIQTATDDLFAGADPATVRAVLLKARESHDFDCESVDCPQFEYLLGLTYELTGDEREAVQTYLDLWRTYPDSPFTIMARAKLELMP